MIVLEAIPTPLGGKDGAELAEKEFQAAQSPLSTTTTWSAGEYFWTLDENGDCVPFQIG